MAFGPTTFDGKGARARLKRTGKTEPSPTITCAFSDWPEAVATNQNAKEKKREKGRPTRQNKPTGGDSEESRIYEGKPAASYNPWGKTHVVNTNRTMMGHQKDGKRVENK